MANLYVGDVRIAPGTKAYDLMTSGKPEDQKKAKRLVEYCEKARAAFYKYEEVQKLREQYKDVV